MAFDKSTRNRLAKFVADARDVIADEFTEQFQSLYGISSTGEITALEDLRHLDDAGLAIAERLRERIDYLVKTHPDEADGDEMAVKRLAREQAFTILNRFAAVRMAEKRGLIEESVGQGYQSKGFRVFETVAGSGIGEIYERYRRFLFCLFDELTVDLGVLFDRASPSSLLFPRETALLDLLELFQAGDLERLWEEDETIGWIYQYYNTKEENKAAKVDKNGKPKAPQNSRELAIRNQFFTPRYVVEFLTDNTLGRIWYEVTRGETRLRNQCHYLVRRPNEIFLKPVDEFGFNECREWVQEVLTGNFAAAEPDATWEEMSAVALALDGEGVAEQLGLGDIHDSVRERGDRAIEQGQVDDATLLDQWLLLFSVQRGILREGLQGRDEKYGKAARAVWEAWVRAAKGEAEDSEDESLSQEEVLKQPVIIPLRPAKDPREIRLLDPACGSMHFGLYAFDLFEAIYDEAWDLEGTVELLREDLDRKPLRESFDSKEEYLRHVPRLIIEHNIHGVDIDPRAVQIAGLSLWLRAQKSWQSQEVRPAGRPRVRRSNIVCAEPMPGSEEMLEEFAATLDLPLLGELVKTVFEKMQLAGEAGTLLKIEEEIRSAIQEAKKAWEALESKPQELFSTEELNQTTTHPELSALDRSLTRGQKTLTAHFWETAEQQVIAALRGYAEQADADSFQKRLFADEAARGFAFIDLCRKRYDVIVMNPPFGDWSSQYKAQSRNAYPNSYNDILGAFVDRGGQLATLKGKLGAITSRTCFFLTSFTNWREKILLAKQPPELIADLGNAVMDEALVEAAAYVVSIEEDSISFEKDCLSFRVLGSDTPEIDLLESITKAVSARSNGTLFITNPKEFSELPTSPLAYWISPTIRSSFRSLGAFEGDGRSIKQGLGTGDDFRFVRVSCETLLNLPTAPDYTWLPFAKGGAYSPFYSDIYLRVNWKSSGIEMIKNTRSTIRNPVFYHQSGVTWSDRTTSLFSARAWPAGGVFSVKGSAGFFPDKEWLALALMNSRAFNGFLGLLVGASDTAARSYQVGTIGRVPYPNTDNPGLIAEIEDIARSCYAIKSSDAPSDEGNSLFQVVPIRKEESLLASHLRLKSSTEKREENLRRSLHHLDKLIYQLYQFSESDILVFENSLPSENAKLGALLASPSNYSFVSDNFSYVLGAAFGRWDARYATGERQPPVLPGPFDPLPVCPPGMLQNDEGLPAEPKDVPADYPLRISWPGILVDDENHPEDIVARVREALEVIWKDRAEAIEEEACEILGVSSLRDYFAKPAKFFADHLKRYSKSRRQAPIYWPLSTKSGSYTLWLYYHRLSDQTLHTCLADFLDPKIKKTQKELDDLNASGKGGTRIGELRDFLDELHDLRDEIERVIKLPWKPNLNDGVLITASPLHKLFGLTKWRNDLEKCWKKLEKGDFDWAHLAYSIWPQRVEKACETDRSIAIAHDREDLCKVEPPKPKKKRAKKKA